MFRKQYCPVGIWSNLFGTRYSSMFSTRYYGMFSTRNYGVFTTSHSPAFTITSSLFGTRYGLSGLGCALSDLAANVAAVKRRRRISGSFRTFYRCVARRILTHIIIDILTPFGKSLGQCLLRSFSGSRCISSGPDIIMLSRQPGGVRTISTKEVQACASKGEAKYNGSGGEQLEERKALLHLTPLEALQIKLNVHPHLL